MRRPFVLAGLAALAIPVAAFGAPKKVEDLIVIGRLKNLSYESLKDPDDVLGHGWITADLRVKQLLQGRERRRILRVRYFAHTYLREDKDFRFQLRASAEAGYLICGRRGSAGYICD